MLAVTNIGLEILCTFIPVINYNTRYSFFRTDILNKTGILMKLTKNLVIIATRFWTRYLIEQKGLLATVKLIN